MEKPLLEFRNVTIAARPPFEGGMRDFSAVLRPGDLLAVKVDKGYARTPLADAGEGLIEPDGGAVLVLGEDWRSLSPDRGAELRGRIGRVFDEHGWISNLDMDENVTLCERHHTLRPEEDIHAEAVALAAKFGMKELPAGRLSALPRADRRRTEWVRAFMGKPVFILLEHPMRNVYAESASSLAAEVRSACARGAGVIWITGDPHEWDLLKDMTRYRIEQEGPELVRREGT